MNQPPLEMGDSLLYLSISFLGFRRAGSTAFSMGLVIIHEFGVPVGLFIHLG
jgi:hypothetical protein